MSNVESEEPAFRLVCRICQKEHPDTVLNFNFRDWEKGDVFHSACIPEDVRNEKVFFVPNRFITRSG